MHAQGHLRKMTVQPGPLAEYALVLDEQTIPLNPYLGQPVQLRFTGRIHCVQCGRETRRSFQQGYCYPCLQRLAECHFCILHPEKCHISQGACPENDWAHAQCAQPHIVYLANSSGLKVGITRQTQMPTRWLDQGACQALPIFRTANRYQAGVVEVCLKQFISDRTDWRKLLRQPAPVLDLVAEHQALMQQAETSLQAVISQLPANEIVPWPDQTVAEFTYPVQCYPPKIVSWSLDRTPLVSGTLQGIKGQYWLYDHGVINIRHFSGYEVEFIGGVP